MPFKNAKYSQMNMQNGRVGLGNERKGRQSDEALEKQHAFVKHKVAKWPVLMLPIFSHKFIFLWAKMFHICLTVHHTSKSESLSVTERMVPPSPRSFILETLVVGLAAAHGDSAELCGVHPDSDMERRPL